MITRMAKVELVGPKDDLMATLDLLHSRGIFQLDPHPHDQVLQEAADRPRVLVLDPAGMRERLFFESLRERIATLLAILPECPAPPTPLPPLPVMELLDELIDGHLAVARRQDEQVQTLRQEEEQLTRNLLFWNALEPLWAELPPGANLELFGVTIRHADQLVLLEQVLRERLAGRCELSSTVAADGTLVGLIACDREMAVPLRAALTSEQVPEMPLPPGLADLPLAARVATLRVRLAECRSARQEAEAALVTLSRDWHNIYQRAREWLDERLELYGATVAIHATRQCFVVQGWLAADAIGDLRQALQQTFAGRVVLDELAILEDDLERVPVQLRNSPYFAPFELFSRLLPLPRYTSYDPTPFIGIFFPVLFGLMLGDIGYGAVLFAIAAPLARRGRGVAGDLGKILGIAALYTMFFGVIFGELFGDLGQHWLGLHPLWLERSAAMLPTMLLALAVGAAHILFGLLLGVWSELRRHRGRAALLRLALLVTVLLLILTAFSLLFPAPWLTTAPLLTGVAILLPILIAAGGLLAPLELLKTLGNIISYVRIMAIGIGSVLLAVVANQVGGAVGNLFLGILIAGILHAFNLVLGVFAPTVHALRLHYVEFFSQFLDLGGRRFEPFGKSPPTPQKRRP
jgi:V/A-type H+-transporting ATPase subunit I